MALTQAAYVFGADSGSESTHPSLPSGTWASDINVPISRAATNSSTFLLRILLQNNATAANNTQPQFQYRKNGGAWTNITTTSANVKAVSTTVFANDAHTTSRLGGSGTFEASSAGCTHDGLAGAGNVMDVVASGRAETLCSLQLVPADLVQGDVLEFQVTHANITAWTAIPIIVVTGTGDYVANPVNLDGTNDYLTRGAALTGIADSTDLTFSFWFRRTGNNGILARFLLDNVATARMSIHMLANNEFGVVGRDAAGATVLELETLITITDTDWHHVMMSRNGTTRHLYIDGSSSLDTKGDTGGAIDFNAHTDVGIGASAAGANKFTGDLADVWVAFGQYVDLSQAGNREKFLSVEGTPVDLGPLGETPLGSRPTIFLSGPTGSWHVNRGTGAGFTEVGAFTDGAVPLPVGGYDPLVADVGHFTMTGYAAGLRVNRLLLAQAGSFDMTGYAAGLVAHRELGAAVGHFLMTGYDAGLTYTPVGAGYDPLVADVAHFTMTGYPAGLSVGRKLPAAVGHFIMTGYAAGLRASRKLVAEAGSFGMTGYPAGLYRGILLPAVAGHFLMTGYDAGLTYTPGAVSHDPLVAAVGHFVMTGYAVGLRVSRKLPAVVGHFTMTGYPAGFGYQRRLKALTGHFTMTGYTAGLNYTGGSLPLNWHSDLLPLIYVPSPAAPADPLVLAEEFRNIQTVLDHYAIITLQVADREPQVKLRGMMRWAVNPWDPLSTGAWPYLVYWTGFEWLAL